MTQPIEINAITISGEVSSGKSSITDQLIRLLPGWQRINTGQLFRDFLSSRGESIQKVSLLPDSVHRDFDLHQEGILREQNHVIVEGRLSGWIARNMPNVFKVFCFSPLDTRVQRYMKREGCSKDRALEDIQYRDEGDLDKFRTVYGVQNYRSEKYYNLMLDTSDKTPLELAQMIVRHAGLSRDGAK